MTGRERLPGVDRFLPLTERTAASSCRESVTEADVRVLVGSFYESVRDDALLGPIFDRRVSDWSAHLPKMCDFWCTVVLREPRYAGRPLEAHQRIPGLDQSHFDRWLLLWDAAVGRVIAPPAREAFVVAARRMAASMGSRLGSIDRAG